MALAKKPILKFRFGYLNGCAFTLLLFSIGAFFCFLNTHSEQANYFEKFEADYLIATIDEPLIEKKNSFKSVLKIEGVLDGNGFQKACGRILVYFGKESANQQLVPGDELIIANNLQSIQEPRNPGQFNYKQYLSFHQIHHQVYLSADTWSGTRENRFHWQSSFDALRNSMLEILEEQEFDNDEFAVAAALLLGKKDELDPELVQSFASAGAMHVLAVSGLHVGILFMVLNVLLKFMNVRLVTRILKATILLFVVWLYAALTGMSPSVVRASTMFSAIILGGILGYKSSIFNTIGSSAFLLLLIYPYYLMEVGFQLSYLAVLSIVYIQPRLFRLWEAPNKVLNFVWGITSVSIAAQIGTFPLGLLYFHQFPTLFIFSNLVVIPGAYLILAVGIILFLLCGINYLLKGWIDNIIDFIAVILKWMVNALNLSVEFVEQIPYSLITGIDIGIGESWLLYTLIVFALLYLAYKRFYWIIAVLLISNAFCLEQVREKRHLHQSAFLTVYDIKSTSAVNFVKRDENILLTDSALMYDEQRQLFHIKNNWNKKDAKSPFYMNYQSPDSNHHRIICNGFYQFKGDLIVHFHENHLPQEFNKQLQSDVLIVSDNIWMNWQEVNKHYHPKIVVIDSSIKNYIAKKWRQELKKLGIAFWDVGQLGAYIKQY